MPVGHLFEMFRPQSVLPLVAGRELEKKRRALLSGVRGVALFITPLLLIRVHLVRRVPLRVLLAVALPEPVVLVYPLRP